VTKGGGGDEEVRGRGQREDKGRGGGGRDRVGTLGWKKRMFGAKRRWGGGGVYRRVGVIRGGRRGKKREDTEGGRAGWAKEGGRKGVGRRGRVVAGGVRGRTRGRRDGKRGGRGGEVRGTYES